MNSNHFFAHNINIFSIIIKLQNIRYLYLYIILVDLANLTASENIEEKTIQKII